ncbi:AfsR/SARP family transcriptional regulator [Actinoplanes flavus]|uniref:Winged helix-turn-helix domain-containing protein n=1 Tax=Actinoplanes flavus TaxID=2820290 RepID=A0ABS3UEA1_9ACTN|nr:BTAD domain-containing putative transcriptional regulator [Actinoplanes flavus]MBO3736766.1 winged helix-turn-helix domain-containing protein [Actinoplanes flavus]
MRPLDIGVLGRTSVLVDGDEAAIGGPGPRAVLCRLVVSAGLTVPDDELIDAVWPSGPPPSAKVTLQGHIAALRRALEPERAAQHARVLLRGGAGYRLVLDADAVDADRFTALSERGRSELAAARPAEAAHAFEQALALWRGRPYADCVDRGFADGESMRLEQLRVDAEEGRLEAELALGDHVSVAARLAVFTREHPLREHAWTLLATALYRAGRIGDALAALRSARDVLAEELGTDPGPELEALQNAILRQDPRLLAVPERVEVAPPAPGAHPGNLPAALSTLIGRSHELDLIATLIQEHRLVTLTGTGGIGKTRLAVETARRHGGDDGPWLVELAGLHDPTLVADTIAGALSIAANGNPAVLLDALRRRTTLIVLDNCEQIVDGVAEFVTTLLRACPDVRVLATSREVLQVEGERRFEVPPLSAGAAGEAVELFAQRAAAVDPDGAAGLDGARDAVVRLCADLDNLPLAIELAAAQCAVLSVDQLATLAHDRFVVLRGGPRGNRRHATILATVQWSWDLLSDAEKESFTALAIFAGGFDLRAAMLVTRSTDVVAHLDTLTAKSMVTVVGGNPRRYRILETLRRFAERQRTEERTTELRNRHAAWVGELADEAVDALRDARSAQWMARLSAEHANVRAALDHSRDDPAVSLRICAGIYWYWYRTGHTTEGLRYVRPVVEHWLAADDADAAPVRLRIFTTIGLAVLSYLGGDLATVGWALTHLGRLATGADDPVAVAEALTTLAYFEAGGGHVAEAEQHAGAAVQLARDSGATRTEAEALMSLGTAHLRAGDLDRAAAALTASIEAAERSGNAWCRGSSSWLLAKCRVAQGQFGAQVDHLLADALTHVYAEGDRTSWIVKLTTLAYVRFRQGRTQHAAELLAAALHQGELIGYSPVRMDPVDVGRYVGEMTGQPDDVAAARGRTLTHPQIALLVQDMG